MSTISRGTIRTMFLVRGSRLECSMSNGYRSEFWRSSRRVRTEESYDLNDLVRIQARNSASHLAGCFPSNRRFPRPTLSSLSWLPRLIGLIDELWHQGQRECGTGLSWVLPSRCDGFVLPIVLLHHYLFEHTGLLTLYLVAAECGCAVFRDEELETSCCKKITYIILLLNI